MATPGGSDAAGNNSVGHVSTELTAMYLPILEKIQGQLDEVERNQNQVMEQEPPLDLERFAHVEKTFSRLPGYVEKLQRMKKDMKSISERVERVRKRSSRLYEKKVGQQ